MIKTALTVITMSVSSSLHWKSGGSRENHSFVCIQLFTGMTFTDVWRLSQYHKLISNAKYEYGLNLLTIKKFTGVLAKQLTKIAMSCDAALDPLLSPTA
jgi:hypothetical protein